MNTPDTEEKCKVCKGTGWNPEKTMFAEFCSACDDDDYKTTPDTVCTNYMQEIPCKCECHNSNLQLCSMCCHHHGYIWHEEHKQAVSSRDTYWKERVEAYNELILAVESKCEGETRHQTALRYIKQAEQRPELASEAMCGECLKSMESGAIIYPRRTCPFHATPITNEDNLK